MTDEAFAVVSAREEFILRKKVDDADCVEVFFVPEFSPSNLHGGGATWLVGVEGAKVIISDEQVNCSPDEDGVDLTHLAHQVLPFLLAIFYLLGLNLFSSWVSSWDCGILAT